MLPRQYCPHVPTETQAAALWACDVRDVFFGGGAGGGKSDWLLMEGLRFVETPGYNAIIFRRSYADLNLPDGLITRSHEWLAGTDAEWNGTEHKWTFPSRATLNFGYMENAQTRFRYKSSAFHMIGFDELTTFEQVMLTFMFTRLRRPADGPASKIPLRMRSASNPGDIGHQWVKDRYITGAGKRGRLFIPSLLKDNPHLDREAYIATMQDTDPVTRAQMLAGDWDVRPPGSVFHRDWYGTPVDGIARAGVLIRLRFWDLAASESPTAKYTAGVRMAVTNEGRVWLEHVVRGRWTPGKRDDVIAQTAATDPEGTQIYIEQEPGSGGISQIDTLKRRLFKYAAREAKVTGDKGTRAGPFASHSEAGHIALCAGPWNEAYLDELEAFQIPVKQEHIVDQVDASSGAYNVIAEWLEMQKIEFTPERSSDGWEVARPELDPPEDPLAAYRPRPF